jgi:hypothetical protein
MIKRCTFLASVAALFLATGTAHAEEEGWLIGKWDCPGVSVDGASIELRKYAVHFNGVKVEGRFQVNPLRIDIKELKDGTITFNGKRCRPMNEEQDRVVE